MRLPTSRCLARSTALSDTYSGLGRVAEWFKAPVLKTGVPARVPWVRIPPLPPKYQQNQIVDLIGAHQCTNERTIDPDLMVVAGVAIFRGLR